VKVQLIVAGGIFAVGVSTGAKTVTPEVDFVEIPRTKIIHEEAPPPEEVEVVPESCLDALRYAEQLQVAADHMYDRGEAQKQIIKDVLIAIEMGTPLKDLMHEQRQLEEDLVGDLYDMSVTVPKYEEARKECREDMP
jgi:hypothetical protein